MAYSYSQSYVALGSSSTATSTPFFVGDFRLLTISFQSRASLGASRLTIEGSNANGLDGAADFTNSGSLSTSWSVVTGINMVGRTPGTVALDTGYRWVRAIVPVATQSAASYTTAIFNGVSF